MKRYFLLFIGLVAAFSSCVQQQAKLDRPKLVVGLVVDQMRWDYLYRYYNKYGSDGFKKLLNDGYSCENTMLNYIPSFTAPGHACIYTGAVPSINGIAGNNWIDNQTGKACYCVDDTTVFLAGDEKKAPSMSPGNLHTTTITDELRLATNFSSRVYGVAIKDRGAILPAGHTGIAYWYDDKTGNFVTSTYYPKQYQNPAWLQAFNKKNVADSLAKLNWKLLYAPSVYTESTNDTTAYEEAFKGENSPVFPHKVDQLTKPDRVSAVKTMPAGNTLTFMMAEACMEGAEGGKLGSGKDADFLCISLSSTDYAGHQFAPNSMEVEDMYLRLDKDIALFLNYLDRAVGKGNYLLFLTADHGGAHNPQFLKDNKVPAGIWFNVLADLNMYLKEQYRRDSPLVNNVLNYQVFLNEQYIARQPSLNRDKIKASITGWLQNIMPVKYNVPVSYVIDMEDINKTVVPEPIRTMAVNGYDRLRSGPIQIILNPGWFEADRFTGTTHGTWNPYDTHIPLLWYGWHIPRGKTNEQVSMTDISATLAALLHIQMPNGCIGKPISTLNP